MTEIHRLRQIANIIVDETQDASQIKERNKLKKLDELGDKYMPKIIVELEKQAQNGYTFTIGYVKLDNFSTEFVEPKHIYFPKSLISQIIQR